jgi:hypothetical protein
MPNFIGRNAFGRRSGTITMIEEPVRRSAARTAKIVACVTFVAVGLLSATVLSGRFHPIIALFVGALTGLVAAFIVGSVVITWPVLRVIWWWSIEITAAVALVVGWVQLSEHTLLPYRLVAVALIAGVPASIPPVRRRVVAVAWCVITRHRIRTCFSEFIITNRTGSLPLIMLARPTPVGERVWIWLRPGLDLDAIQQRLELIAVACWASAATAEAASAANAAWVRLDIKRRDALAKTITAPLLGLVSPGTPRIERDAAPVPTALDLPDVDAADVTPRRPSRTDTKPPATVPVIKSAPAETAGDEPAWKDWI